MKQKNVLALNAICPIIVGAFIYYLISPDVFFVKKIDEIIDCTNNIHITKIDNIFLKLLRNYFIDMLWGYALIFALVYIIDNNAANIWKIFLIAFFFSAGMEIIQLLPFVQGTFDVIDIVMEIFAEILAVFIIKKLLHREETQDEKKN